MRDKQYHDQNRETLIPPDDGRTGRLVLDIETLGFTGRTHGISIIDIDTGAIRLFADHHGYERLADAIPLLENAPCVIGHNISIFDIPRLNRDFGLKIDRNYDRIYDTLIATRVLWPDLRDTDEADGIIDVNLYGKHSLKAWGQRLGVSKGEFQEWTRWSPELMAYCRQDTITSWALFAHVLDRTSE
jgi:DNA polymerase I